MVFTDWTYSATYLLPTGTLDTAVKYAGNSSFKIHYSGGIHSSWGILTHNTFSEPQASVIVQTRYDKTVASIPNHVITHSAYGGIAFVPDTQAEWQKFKATFWYDADSDIKWGRVEKWIDSAWVQQGTDLNMGSGSPSAGSISLRGLSGAVNHGSYLSIRFDEVEVSA